MPDLITQDMLDNLWEAAEKWFYGTDQREQDYNLGVFDGLAYALQIKSDCAFGLVHLGAPANRE